MAWLNWLTETMKTPECSSHIWRSFSTFWMKTSHPTELNQNDQHNSCKVGTWKTHSQSMPMTRSKLIPNFFWHKCSRRWLWKMCDSSQTRTKPDSRRRTHMTCSSPSTEWRWIRSLLSSIQLRTFTSSPELTVHSCISFHFISVCQTPQTTGEIYDND
jgi:hypothetical protein